MIPYQRDTLLEDLRHNVVDIHFTKVNGEARVLRCTLQRDLLPEQYQTDPSERAAEKDFHNTNKDIIAAWDVQANGWRSFRIDSVYYVQAVVT